jgi:uncharacterized protein (DUF39 family)
MPEKIMRVHIPDGAVLSSSRTTPGRHSPLTRDSGTHQLGQVTLSEVDESNETSKLVTTVALLVIAVAMEKAAPHVKQWVKDSTVPAMKASRERMAKAVRRGKRAKNTQISVVVEPAIAGPSTEVAEAVDTPAVTMTRAEWLERFRLMLVAGAFHQEQWRLLSAARVEDGDDVREVQRAMENLSPQQVAERMRQALEANRSVLDPETSAAMAKIFAGIRVDDGKHALPSGGQPE